MGLKKGSFFCLGCFGQ